tara:strand:+ start:4418 stop:5014 length:597 start_codon:yes stop_codon:yes gene_type:complete
MIPDWQFYYWGPLLFRTTISSEDILKLKSICHKNPENDFRKKLAGILKYEYTIDPHKFISIIGPYLKEFREAMIEWYACKDVSKIEVKTAWVNYMKAGEFNPPHVHGGCDFSSVIFLDIPEELKKENKEYVGTAAGPGSLQFMSGESLDYTINQKTFFPAKGDFFMFAATLRHLVYPFQSNIERVSIAANFKVEIVDK